MNKRGQAFAEYTIMLAVLLIIGMGIVKLIGSHALTRFSTIGSALSQ
jgi:Flp pilus assembly pilin Flp